MSRKRIRKIFLDELPKKYGFGATKNKLIIDWYKSIGHKIKFIYDDIEGILEILFYDGNYLSIKYLYGEEFKIKPEGLRSCSLGNLLNKTTSKFKYEIGQRIVDEKRDITITDKKIIIAYDNNNKKYKYKYYKYCCNKCGYDCGEHYNIIENEFKEDLWILESNLLTNKNGCACCCNPSKIVVEHINSVVTTDSWMIKYFQNGHEDAKRYTGNSNKKIYPICPDCGRIKDKPMTINSIHRTKSIGCICGDGISYPNKFMFCLLTQLNIEFEREYSPDWIKPRAYDFYISNLNLIIEMDGELGHGKRVISKKGITKQESLEIDSYKDKTAKEHNIKIIRINCDESRLEYIKQNILRNKAMNKFFNLNIIDWLQCEEFALNNLVKKACEIKRDNSNLTTGDIGSMLNLEAQTVRRYLIRGSNIWDWISYNSAKEKEIYNKKRIKKSIESCSKEVEIFKDGISLGIFKSCSELSRKSEKLFGVKLNSSKISAVCLGNQKSHKGYTFKYKK